MVHQIYYSVNIMGTVGMWYFWGTTNNKNISVPHQFRCNLNKDVIICWTDESVYVEVIIEGPVHRLYFFWSSLELKKKKKNSGDKQTNKQSNRNGPGPPTPPGGGGSIISLTLEVEGGGSQVQVSLGKLCCQVHRGSWAEY